MSKAAEADRVFEQELVGAALTSPELLPEIAATLSEADFSDKRSGWAWRQMVKLLEQGAPVDYLSLSVAGGPAARSGIVKWINEITSGVPRMKSLEWYAARVRDRATARFAASQLGALAAEVGASAEAGETLEPSTVDGLLNLASKLAARSNPEVVRARFPDMRSEIEGYLERWGKRDAAAIPTGLWRVDRNLGGGLRRGKLITVGATTGGGKTSLVGQWAMFAARAGFKVLFFSLEVEPLDLFVRDVERESGFSKWDRLKYSLAAETQRAAIERLSKEPNLPAVVWGSKLTLAQLRAEVLRFRFAAGGLDLIVVDHAQVVAGPATEAKELPIYLRLQNTAEALRQMAIRLSAAVVVSSQMNPAPKTKEGKSAGKTSKDQTRFGQELPNASDAVLLVHHEWETGGDGLRYASESKLILDKNRLGAMGELPVDYDAKSYRFSNTKEDEQEAQAWEARLAREGLDPAARENEKGPEPPQAGLFDEPAEPEDAAAAAFE